MRLTAALEKPINRKGVGRVARGKSLPAPIEGWDAVSPLAGMKPTRAIQLDNWFPQPGYIDLRRGHDEHSDTSSGEPVESLMAYQGTTGSNLKAATGGEIFDVTANAAAGSAEITSLSNDRWQHVNFTTIDGLNFLWICNGADDSRRWDGTSWSVNAISGGITGPDVANVNVFKGRLWLVENGTLNPWYLAVGAVQGSATEFPLHGVFRRGGFLQAIGTWSLDGGAGPDDLIAFVSSRGEVAVYSGVDPATDLVLKGVYETGTPIGRRCLEKVGGDLMLISIDGVLPLSQALVVERGALASVAITKLIQPVVNQSARDWGSNFGWELRSYPRGTAAILNVPVNENSGQRQYVLNTVTGAWTRYLGLEANCWEILNDRIFFGGNDGIVYEFDLPTDDNGEPIVCDVRCAFNYFGRMGQLKRWTMCRPLLTSDGQITPGIALNVDFGTDAPISEPQNVVAPIAQWDVAQWDVDVWPVEERVIADWQSVTGIGYAASLRMLVNVDASQGVTLRLNGYDLLMEDGGLI